jgi:hypothetical protein
MGLALAPVRWAGQKVGQAFLRPDHAARDAEFARALATQGSARDRLVRTLVDGILARDANAATGRLAGNQAAIAAAIAGNAALRDRLQRR